MSAYRFADTAEPSISFIGPYLYLILIVIVLLMVQRRQPDRWTDGSISVTHCYGRHDGIHLPTAMRAGQNI